MSSHAVYKDTPVLVTGGAGFIGSHITERLVSLGARVTVVDDLSSGSLDFLSTVRSQIVFHKGSITDRATCDNVMPGKNIIFHCAAVASVTAATYNPTLCHAVNVTGTFMVLEAARLYQVPTIVFSSSAAVYGNRQGVCSENMDIAPISIYGYSKFLGELYCQEYARLWGLKTIILRYFNVYGDRQRAYGTRAGVIAQFKERMASNEPVTVFGDGTQKRDFVSVEDVVEANLIVASRSHEETSGQVFNIGTGRAVAVRDLIAMLQREFPLYNKPIIYAPARSEDINDSQADCSKYLRLCSSL